MRGGRRVAAPDAAGRQEASVAAAIGDGRHLNAAAPWSGVDHGRKHDLGGETVVTPRIDTRLGKS
jgi:hypothetical protein